MKDYKEFLKEGFGFTGGRSTTRDADKIAAYNDLTPDQRKTLDDYCTSKFGKRFMSCGFEEQSTARSVIFSEKEDPDGKREQDEKDKNF